ncbi:MAG TPA: VTT domain-containing protein [Pseudolabrys sp.]|nr:VTT domain-containing protein [Pseudolabrys sp.]
MSAGSHPRAQPVGYFRRLLPLVAIIILAAVGFYTIGGEISFDALVRHRTAIDTFVTGHRVLAVLAYVGIYIVTVALSLPGATFLTVAGGFLFGVAVGATAAVLGATIGATLIFLAARTALGEPLLRWAGPRANKLASEFREEAFRYLLFLRLVPVFPFFIVNLVPAFAGVRLGPFVAATALGIIPAAIAFAFAGTGLDSVITAQVAAYHQCLGSGSIDCRMIFDPVDILTPQMISALVVLGLLVLIPVVVKRWRARSPNTM